MIQRIGRRKYNIYAFDVESHNDEESISKGETSIWLASFIDNNSKIDNEDSYFYDMESCIDKWEELSTKPRNAKTRPINNICIYIFNLAFEWSFILPVLLKKGFTFKEQIEKQDEYVFNSVSTKSCSSVWEATLKFSKKGGYVKFRDMSKTFSGSLRKVAKSFGLPTQKGDIDYRLNRLHGHKVTTEEKEYCFKDTRIIIDMLLILQEKGDKDFFNTISSASYSCKKMLRYAFPHAYRPLKTYRLDKYFPLLDKEESEFVRKSVEGGLTYPTRDYQFKNVKNLIHIDAHQMHPSQMATKLFPRGFGEYFKGKPTNTISRINCCRVLISYTDAPLYSNIKLIGREITDREEITIWDFEIPTMFKVYKDLKIEFIDGYSYKSNFLPMKQYYIDNYEKRKVAKANNDAFNINFYKLLNNSTYGKFLEHGHNEIIENCINKDGVIDSIISLKSEDKQKINATYTYLPVGSCIPAYSRVCLIETALKFGIENLVYFDTDSIFLLKTPETEKILSTLNLNDELGGWGREADMSIAQFTAPKRYKGEELQEDGTTKLCVHMAGINFPENEMPTYDELDLETGHYSVNGKLRAKGGTLIIFKDKQLQIQKKYLANYNKNSKILKDK